MWHLHILLLLVFINIKLFKLRYLFIGANQKVDRNIFVIGAPQ